MMGIRSRDRYILPLAWLQTLNVYRDFAHGTMDLYSAFPLGKVATAMSDEHEEELNASQAGTDDDAEYSTEEIDAVRRAFVVWGEGRSNKDFCGGGEMCRGEGFIECRKVDGLKK